MAEAKPKHKSINKFIGKELYLISAGMVFMQIVLYFLKGHFVITSTLIAGCLFMIGNILRMDTNCKDKDKQKEVS